MAAKILNLSTTDFDRPTVVIDGEPYEMLASEEITASMRMEMNNAVQAVEGDDRDPIEADDEVLSRQVLVTMPDLPGAVLAKLSYVQKAQILKTFLARFRDAIRMNEPDDSSPSPAPNASTGAN